MHVLKAFLLLWYGAFASAEQPSIGEFAASLALKSSGSAVTWGTLLEQVLQAKPRASLSVGGPDRSDKMCGVCGDERHTMAALQQQLWEHGMKWDKLVAGTPYGMMVKQWGLPESRFKNKPELPRWLVVGASRDLQSTEIYESNEDGTTETYTPDEQLGIQMEGMYWLALVASECHETDLAICAKFSDKDGALSHLSFYQQTRGWVLELNLLRPVSITPDVCNKTCTDEYRPVCGSDNKTYSNKCQFRVGKCLSKDKLTVLHQGECEGRNKMDSFLA